MQISNGAGGVVSLAGVDPKNRLLTYSTSRQESLSRTYDGQSYAVFVNVTPNHGSTIFFILGTNTSDYPVVVNMIRLWSDADIDHVDVLVGPYGTPTIQAPTPDKPINKNVPMGKACPWTVSIGTEVAIPTDLVAIDSIPVPSNQYIPTYEIILQPGSCLALRTTSGSSSIRGSVHFYLMDGVKTGSWYE